MNTPLPSEGEKKEKYEDPIIVPEVSEVRVLKAFWLAWVIFPEASERIHATGRLCKMRAISVDRRVA